MSTFLGRALACVVVSPFAITLFGCSPANMFLPDVKPPVVTTHEGTVSKVVVNDPHDGGWSDNQSAPRLVILTIKGADYELHYPGQQAAAVKPGDTVVVECRQYEDLDRSCDFVGLVLTQPKQPD